MIKLKALVIIDPQNDFCKAPQTKIVDIADGCDKAEKNIPGGSLYVDGADADMARLSVFIRDNAFDITDIYITADDHKRLDIAHPMWWVNSDNYNPDPFTVITARDVINGTWKSSVPEYQYWTELYIQKLDDQGNYPHVIWPYHCIAGTEGAAIVPVVVDALRDWEDIMYKSPELIRKGQDPLSEHYSAVKAEVVTADPRTNVNQDFISELMINDEIIVAGEALSHCVANTVRDMIRYNIDPKKIIILSDCTSSVTTFEELGESFQREMELIGVRFMESTEYESE
jgi:nicotinamidase-related amidase